MNKDNIIKILNNIIKNTNAIAIKESILEIKCIIEENYYDNNSYIFIENNVYNIKCSNIIGEGDTKICYNCNEYNDIVIKKDKYQNINACLSEFIFWCLIRNTNKNIYFAPCIGISKTFDGLIMKKVNLLKKNNCEIYFNECNVIRDFCNNIGYYETNDITRNFGTYDNKLVLCDYSMQTKYDTKYIQKLSSFLE